MITDRLFKENNTTDFLHSRRGFATVWLIAAICFVVVFLGIVFLLLRDKTPDREPKPVAATFKQEVREPIKSSVPLNKTPETSGKPPERPGQTEKKLPETMDQQAQASSTADASGMQDVLPDDPPGKGMLAQDLTKPEVAVSPEGTRTSELSTPPSAEKPPSAVEHTESAQEELQPKGKEAAAASPPEVSAPSEKPPVVPPEIRGDANPQPVKDQTDVKSQPDEKSMKEVTVRVLAGNVRKGPSVKEAVIFKIARGDKLRMTRQKGNWYAVRTSDGRSGWAHHTLFNKSSSPPHKGASAVPETGKKGVIQAIRTVVTDPDQAQIIFELNGYYPPEIMVLEGDAPRVVCDFFSARLAPGVKKSFPVKTGAVKRVRVGVHKGSKPKIRVVLDLNAGKNYAVEQFFFEKENYYALTVKSAK